MIFTEEFDAYLKQEKNMADNSRNAYISDVEDFLKFASKRGKAPDEVGNADLSAYLFDLRELGKSGATVNRKLASVRAFYTFLKGQGKVMDNPADGIKSPRIERKDIEILPYEDVEKLITSPDETPKGIRDRALLELMYATGVRPGELIRLKTADLNLRIGFISCLQDNGKTRMVPVGRPARAAMQRYLNEVRTGMLAEGVKDEGYLFVNYIGDPLTRQGVWKIIKYYGDRCQMGDRVSPQILRNSFAAHMVQNGADLKSLQELMGFEDLTAAQIFLKFSKNRIIDVYDRTHPRA